jgi:hypothetical protein
MSKAEREATAEGRKLVKESAALYDEMKRLQEETGKHTLNVGNYKSALESLPGPISGTINELKGMGQQFKALSRSPIGLILGAVVGVVAALGKAFTRSEKGAQLMAKATGFVNGVMSQLVDVSVRVVEGLQNAFNNPKEAIANLGKSIGTNLLNRLKAIPLIAQAGGKALKALFARDLDALKEAGTEAFTAVNQALTGLDAEQQKEFADAVRETVDEVKAETEAFIDLEAQRRAVAKANRELTKSAEDLATIEETNKAIADDITKSFAEREAAAERARKATEDRAKKEIQLARNNLSIINAEINLRRSNGEAVEQLLDQQLGAYQTLRQSEREYTLAVMENERTRAELKQDRLERDLDILIDGFDNQKTINEKIINDESQTIAKREKLLNETRALAEDSFKKQIETIQEFTDIQVDANELITESDAVALNQKIRSLGLSEIIEGRLLEIVRDRKTANSDLAESETALANARKKQLEDTITRAQAFNAKRLANETEYFEQRQALDESEFNLLEATESEKTLFRLNAERERLQKILELNEKHGGDLSKLQIETVKNQIEAINKEIEGETGQINDIYDLFGISLNR